jgi:glycine oxidase
MAAQRITVAGAGILGLWQALTLARAGHRVRLVEASHEPFAAGASQHAGAMLAPDCEAESAPPLVRDLGREGLELWRATYPKLIEKGTLAVAAARDRGELTRFAKLTQGHRTLSESELARLEPDLAARFADALHFPDEAHMAAPEALAFLLNAVKAAGAEVRLGQPWRRGDGSRDSGEVLIDCRGLAARSELPTLRGVRGERLLIRSHEVHLTRPVRLLHPRHPLYVVPWSGGRYLVGATMIESEDMGPVTVRSALELLGAAYTLHPAFGEAEILETGAGVRPAFPDNVPRAAIRDGGRRVLVNGAFRHGFLLAPVLAQAVAGYVESGKKHALITRDAT